jgi:hypothetical protein
MALPSIKDILKAIPTTQTVDANVVTHPNIAKKFEAIAKRIVDAQNKVVRSEAQRALLDEEYQNMSADMDRELAAHREEAATARAEWEQEVDRRGIRGVKPVAVDRNNDRI